MNVLNNCFYSSFAFPMNQGSKSWSDLHLCKIIFICFNNRENYVIYCLGTLLWLIDFTRKVKVKSLSHVRLYVTSWSVRYRAPLSMGFSRQEYSSGVPLPSPCLSLPILRISPIISYYYCWDWAFRWLSGTESACQVGETSLIPVLGRSPGKGNGNPL